MQHVEHAAAHANWRQDSHEADLEWIDTSSLTSVRTTAGAPSSPEDESFLSIFDSYGDRSLYRSLRAQFGIERELTKCSTVPVSDAPIA